MRKWNKIWKTPSERFLKKHQPTVEKILQLEEEYSSLSEEKLRGKTDWFKQRIQEGETLDDLLVEAFATVREASNRVLKMKPYPVQVMGGIILHKGEIAEMKTGEGKTLVATMPTYLNALAGNGVHVVTVNDYLTKRDWELNKPLYDYLNVTSGYVVNGLTPSTKKDAYAKDITYVVNQQLGFDYLNDNMILSPQDRLQRSLSYAIIDEVDSILLDEARTPLVISRAEEAVSPLYQMMNVLVSHLKEEEYIHNSKDSAVYLTEEGVETIERRLGLDNLASPEHAEVYYIIRQALTANYHYQKDKDYLVNEGRLELIDGNTGRVTPGRRFQGGLHQALEAKEGVEIQKETITLASITYQYFFRMYDKIAGMTGTALTESEEFGEVYNLSVIEVPTNKEVKRIDQPDIVYSTREKKMKGIINDVKTSYEKGQPVLIGVSTIEQSEEIHELLRKAKIHHHVLNAKNHAREAEIISRAGLFGAVTVATNMAGRGTDIKLGEGVLEVGGLKVIGTERNMNRRVDNQLRGRAGRQGDPGDSQFHVSLEDELMSVYATDSMVAVIEALGATSGDEAGVVQNSILSGFLERSQVMLEGRHYDTRKQTVEYDSITNDQRTILYKERKQLLDGEVLAEKIIESIADQCVEQYLNELDWNLKDIEDREKLAQKVEEKFLPEFTLVPDDFTRQPEECKKFMNEIITSHIHEQLEFLEQRPDKQLELKNIALSIVDKRWRNHLDEASAIRKGIHFYSYGGNNPIEEYFFQTTTAFENMNRAIQTDFISAMCKMPIKEVEIEHQHKVA